MTVFKAPVGKVPLAAFGLVQSPLALQEVGLFVELHVTVELLPTNIAPGLTDIVTTGTDGKTNTAALSTVPLPLLLLQAIVNV